MNVKNNKRRQQSREKIEQAFVELLQERDLNRITVSDICKRTGLNRSTFYAQYADVYALADAIREGLEQQVADLYGEKDGAGKFSAGDWIRLFEHIRDNQLFYKTYFKLGYDQAHDVNISDLCAVYQIFPERDMTYHVEFFRAGFNAMVKIWLKNGCRETPEQLNAILVSEYHDRHRV